MELNKVYCSDNLEYMKLLPDESVDLIYGDILYATGRTFSDYVDIKANKIDVFDFYTDRIKEMYRILKQAGTIWLQMDTRINHWIRNIMDDVFGYDNFRNEIIWKKRAATMNTITHYFNKNSDRLLYYTKSKDYTFNNVYLPLNPDSVSRYNKIDNNGRKYQLTCILKRNYNKFGTLIFNNKEYKGEYCWTQKTLDNRLKEGYIIEENSLGYLAYRNYLDNSKGVQCDDVWVDLTEGTIIKDYDTQKPLKLLNRIIKACSNENDIVFDPFCGSGSSLASAKLLNRNILGCDINSKAIEITRKRLDNLHLENKKFKARHNDTKKHIDIIDNNSTNNNVDYLFE